MSRTSLRGFYCRKDAPWTQIKTDWEHLWGLKIIKSWRLHFSKQKISTIDQAIWTLFSYYLFRKNIFWLNPKNTGRKVVSNHLSKVKLMIPLLPKLTWTLSISSFFLMLKLVLMTTPALCTCRIKQVPARLWYNFFHLTSLEAPQNLKTVEESRTKVEFDHRRVKNKYTGLL